MTITTGETAFPSLFAHRLRKDWGVGVLAAEADGKRRYLFEDGAERTFAPDFYKMLHRVEQPDEQQRAAHARLRGALAKRRIKDGNGATPEEAIADQLARFHKTFPAGFADPSWVLTIRGEGADSIALHHRQPLIDKARQQLAATVLDPLVSGKHFAQVWEHLVGVLRETDLVPAVQLKLKPAGPDHERPLALAVRELLHGTGPYYQRFDRYLATFTAAFGQHAKWELATAPAAVLHPREHVCVELGAFRSQLKASGITRAIAAQPTSAGYATFLAHAQLIASKLGEQGEAPRDLLDVRDFVVHTLKPAARPRATPRPRAAKPSAKKAEANTDDSVVSEE